MTRLVLYTGIVVGNIGITITELLYGKRGNKHERLFN